MHRRKKMKRSTGVWLALLLTFVFVVPRAGLAEDLSAAQLGALESNGIPLYPGASYTTGDDSDAMIMWFKSTDSPDKVMDWYKDQLSDWFEMDANGSRVIYKGPEGIKVEDLSVNAHIWARTTDESGVSVDTEITIRIPN